MGQYCMSFTDPFGWLDRPKTTSYTKLFPIASYWEGLSGNSSRRGRYFYRGRISRVASPFTRLAKIIYLSFRSIVAVLPAI